MGRVSTKLARPGVLVVLGWVVVARAAPSEGDKMAAEALFDAGRGLAKEGKLAEACPKFAESYRLDPGVGVLLYLADCYEKTGKLASAWLTWREAAGAARAARQPDREQIALKRSAALEPQLSRIKIDVPADSAVAGLVVLRDGVEVGSALWGVAVPVDAGEHVVEARAPGRKAWTKTVQVGAQAAQLAITVPSLDLAPVAPPPAASSAPVASASAAPPPPPPPASASAAPEPPSVRDEAPTPARALMLGARLGGLFPAGGTGSTSSGKSMSLSELYGPGPAFELDAGLRFGAHLTGYGWLGYGVLSGGSLGLDGVTRKGADRVTAGVALQVATSHDAQGKVGFFGEVGAVLLQRYGLREEASVGGLSCTSTTTLSGNAARVGGGVHVPLGSGLLLSPFVGAEIGRFVQASYEGSGGCAVKSGDYGISQREVHASLTGGAAISYGFGL